MAPAIGRSVREETAKLANSGPGSGRIGRPFKRIQAPAPVGLAGVTKFHPHRVRHAHHRCRVEPSSDHESAGEMLVRALTADQR